MRQICLSKEYSSTGPVLFSSDVSSVELAAAGLNQVPVGKKQSDISVSTSVISAIPLAGAKTEVTDLPI